MRVFLLGFLRQSRMFRNEKVLWAGGGERKAELVELVGNFGFRLEFWT